MAKKQTHAQLKKKVDEWFSKHIRWKAADLRGYCTCYTCNAKHHSTKIHAGHFLSRRHMATRWEESNVKPQCYACNIHRQGEQWIFGCRIESENPGTTAKLMRQADEGRKFTVSELQHLYEYHRAEADRYAKTKAVKAKPKAKAKV